MEMFSEVVLDGSGRWCQYCHTNWLITVWFRPTCHPIFLYDNPALFIPIICHIVAIVSFWWPTDAFGAQNENSSALFKGSVKPNWTMCYLCRFLTAKNSKLTVGSNEKGPILYSMTIAYTSLINNWLQYNVGMLN